VPAPRPPSFPEHHNLLELAVQFLALAEKQTATAPLMIGHRLMGLSLSDTAPSMLTRRTFKTPLLLTVGSSTLVI
jgi:hypothetical protein